MIKLAILKTMTSRQLGGACDTEFTAETFEEIVTMFKNYVTAMAEKGDKENLKVMDHMRILMQNPEAMQAWFQNKRTEFEGLVKF